MACGFTRPPPQLPLLANRGQLLKSLIISGADSNPPPPPPPLLFMLFCFAAFFFLFLFFSQVRVLIGLALLEDAFVFFEGPIRAALRRRWSHDLRGEHRERYFTL